MARLEVGISATNKELKSVLADSETLVRNFTDNVRKLNIKIGGGTSANTEEQALSNAIKEQKLKYEELWTEVARLKTEQQGLVNENVRFKNSTQQATTELQNKTIATEGYGRAAQQELANTIAWNLARPQAHRSMVEATASYREAEQALTALGNTIRSTAKEFNLKNAAVRQQISAYRQLNAQLQTLDAQMGDHQQNVGNDGGLWGGIGRQLGAVAAGYISVYAAINAVGSVVENNINISDTLSDVQRTAEMTKNEVNQLVEGLKNVPTRTGLNELLEISVIGGQLGIAKEELLGFTQALDFLGVALAKEIPGGAEVVAESLGKINSVFNIAEQEGLTAGEALQKTGNAILALGQAGLATGIFLVDFTKRVSDASKTAGIGLPIMLAYGATLEEAGVSAEVAGTAISKLLGQLAVRGKEFHAIAQMADANLTLNEFTDLINTDADAALRKFFAGLAAGGETTTQFYDILDRAKINTERYRDAVVLLAQDQEKLTRLTKLSADEYNSGAKAAEQFALRNLNLAGVWEQVRRKMSEPFISDTAQQNMADWLAKIFNVTDASDILVRKLNEAKTAFGEQQSSLSTLKDEYVEVEKKVLNGTASHGELVNVSNRIAEILPEAVIGWDKYGNALGINRIKMDELTESHRQLIKEMNISTTKDMNKDFDMAMKMAKRYQNQLESTLRNPVVNTYKRDYLSENAAIFRNRALTIAQNLQSIGAVLTKEQRDLLVNFGMDEAGEAMRRYDKSVKNATKSVEELTDALIEMGEDEPEKKAAKSDDDSAILSLDRMTQLRQEAHLATLKGWEKELQASRYKWDKEFKNAKDSIEQQVELRRWQMAEEARIMSKIGMVTPSGTVVLMPQPNYGTLNYAQPDLSGSGMLASAAKRELEAAGGLQSKLNKTNQQDVSKMFSEITDGLKSVSKRFVTEFSKALGQIGDLADKEFDTIFSHLGNSMLGNFSNIFENQLGNMLENLISTQLKNFAKGEGGAFGKLLGKNSWTIAAAGMVGQTTSSLAKKTDPIGQGIGGALSGAAAGAMFGALGIGIGAIVGGLSGLFGASSAKRQREIQEKQLAEQEKQTALMERQSALAYTSQIIGQQTNQGIVTNVDRDEFGNIRFRIQGQDLVASLDRTNSSIGRGV